MSKKEYDSYNQKYSREINEIKTGYKRVKEKIKTIRQDYSKAVTTGRRSGSGRVILEFYEDFTKLWGGSPSTQPLPFGIDSQGMNDQIDTVEQELEDFNTDQESIRSVTPISVEKGGEDNDSDLDDNISIGSNFSEVSTPSASKKRKMELEVVSNVPQLIDNKRKSLEKRLSAAQRDQKLIEAAKEDTAMRKDMLECFKDSSATTARAMENMSSTLKEMSQGMTQAMVLLANAFTRPRQPIHQNPSFMPHHFNQPLSFGTEHNPSASYTNPGDQGSSFFELN